MAYEYDHDCPFEAFITNLGKYNEGELVGEWVKFPTTSEELQKVFERIGIGSKDDFGNPYEEWFISDYDCYVDGLYEKLGEYENLDELNYLASKLDELDDHDYNHFQVAMQISDYTGSIKDVMTADALRDMVKDVNAKEVSPEERLSDNVYHYDSKDHVFELAEKFEARQQEKKTEIDEKSEEKGSILKDLKDKQKEAAAKPPVKDAAEKAAKTKGGEVL